MTRIDAQSAPDVPCIDCLAASKRQQVTQHVTITVNQGTARKTKNISLAEHAYPADRPAAKQVVNLFTVSPRGANRIPIPVMERHPYTTQSFIPLSASSSRAEYLVVVASDKNGRPDCERMNAWLCHGGQMVTYAKNQWHAPMIALHATLRFIVTNGENGTSDDLEEHYFVKDKEQEVPYVEVPHWQGMVQKMAERAHL